MSGGVKAALDAALQVQADQIEDAQAGLFEDLDEAETGKLDAPSPLSAALPSTAGRRRGRPRGSKNRRTEATAAWLLQQHRHPLSVMAEAYSMTPAQLAERIGLRKVQPTTTAADGTEVPDGDPYWPNDVLLDILKLQMRMAETVSQYVAQRLPQAVQVDASAAFTVQFGGVSLPARGASAGNSGDVIEGQLAVALPQVGRDKSDDDATS